MVEGSNRALWTVEAQETLADLEEQYRRTPNDRDLMITIARFLTNQNDQGEAGKYLRRAGMGITQADDAPMAMVSLGSAYLHLWHSMRSINYGDTDEIFMGDERLNALQQGMFYLNQAALMDEIREDPTSLFQVGLGKEFSADVPEALNAYSAIISDHPNSELLLAAIFKAAVILHHTGQHQKARDYLEYLEAFDIVSAGLSQSMYWACIIHLYEEMSASNRGMSRQLTTQLKVAYMNLQRYFVDERIETDEAKYETIRNQTKEEFHRSPIPWIQLGLEALDSCSYINAMHFLSMAVSKAPVKDLFFLLAQAAWMLQEKERAIKVMEQAYRLDQAVDAIPWIRIRIILSRWCPERYNNEAIQNFLPEEFEDSPDLYHMKRPPSRDPAAKREEARKKKAKESAPPPEPLPPPPEPRKEVPIERSLFREINERVVRRIVRRAMENKMGYVLEDETLKRLQKFRDLEMGYEVKNTRIILAKKYGTADAKPVLKNSAKSKALQDDEEANENIGASFEG